MTQYQHPTCLRLWTAAGGPGIIDRMSDTQQMRDWLTGVQWAELERDLAALAERRRYWSRAVAQFARVPVLGKACRSVLDGIEERIAFLRLLRDLRERTLELLATLETVVARKNE